MPPLQLTPVTFDVDEAREWYEVLPGAMGVEGLVIKARHGRYAPVRREWWKVKHRDTVEVIVGAVLGPIRRPQVVIGGRYTPAGELVQIGRIVPLNPAQSRELAAVLEPGAAEHPWPDEIGNARWAKASSGASKVPLTKVDPTVVVEVSADAALLAGAWRHPLRYLRIRAELSPGRRPSPW